MLGEQQSVVADVFRGASFLAQVVCGSAGVAVSGLSAIAKLLQKLDVLMSQAAASDVGMASFSFCGFCGSCMWLYRLALQRLCITRMTSCQACVHHFQC